MDIKRKIKQAANIIGIDELRKSQVKPINDILEGRDTMVVARPSAGKSAIYQIPALVHGEERTIIIERCCRLCTIRCASCVNMA